MTRLIRLSVAAALLVAAPAVAAPVEQTPYGRAVLRIEGRPAPQQVKDPAARVAREQALARAGVQARWLQMVDNYGGPFINNPFLPCEYAEAAENEAILKAWVEEMHQAGMAAMSWYALAFCKSGWQQHPEWRQVYLEPGANDDPYCCFESGYGQAMIDYCVYAVERLGLDGIWFDGSVWTGIWQRPVPLTCVCASCQAKFQADTGHGLPGRQDWSDPVFRQWVAWRYREFSGFIGRLAGAIRAAHPEAAVVINHYHRPGIPWQSAIPLNPYPADIISGSEATGADRLDLTMRLCRAYGRPQSEVWRPFEIIGTPEESAEALLQHALTAYCAGGYPSYGGNPFDERMAPTAALMVPVMERLHPYVGGDALPYAALHVSQQTETFFFGRGGAGKGPLEPYWVSLEAWTTALGEAHVPPDYVYDADFTPQRLARYGALFMPLSLALGDDQARTALAFARRGGTLLLGMGAGNLDAEGEPRPVNLLGQALGFTMDGAPAPDGTSSEHVELRPVAGEALGLEALRTPLRLGAPGWQVIYRAGTEPAAAMRPYGRGSVIVLDTDPTAASTSMPVSGGDTQMAVARDAAATGKFGLRGVDGPAAQYPFFPDLENWTLPFGAPGFVGAEFACKLRVDAAAQVAMDIRSTVAPIAGPSLSIGPRGQVQSAGQTLGGVPADRWLQVRLTYRFAAEGQTADYDAHVTWPGGELRTPPLTPASPDFHRTDWLVIYGLGTAPARFAVDDVRLTGRRADGSRWTVLDLDFETGEVNPGPARELPRDLARRAQTLAPPPVQLLGPPDLRLGLCRRGDGTVLAHLHNRRGGRADWLADTGPRPTLRCAFPVQAAKLALTGRELAVRQRGREWEIRLPRMGLYQVVEITR